MPLQATSGAASYDAFGGGVAAVPNYIEDVFSTWLYSSTGTSPSAIVNGIDLAGKGGLVIGKVRNYVDGMGWVDTVRGGSNYLQSDVTNEQFNTSAYSFNNNGYSLQSTNFLNFGTAGQYNFCSWTFRKQPKFFDVVTYTGTGSATTIAHNLGSVPGCIIVKRTDSAGFDWAVYHTSTGNTQRLLLNTTDPAGTSSSFWNNTTPTSTVFTVGSNVNTNASGGTYVAYLFAHDAGGFGLTGTDNVISCGSFTTDGSGNATVSLGYEPQWLLSKGTSAGNDWFINDNMRGLSYSNFAFLNPNSSSAETNLSGDYLVPNATGFSAKGFSGSTTFIYIAIRRGPMKVPTSGTSVYNGITRTGTGANATVTGVGFAPDLAWIKDRGGNFSTSWDRLRGATKLLRQTGTSAEETFTDALIGFDVMDGVRLGTDNTAQYINLNAATYINWNFRRAPSFFDEVCYTGTGVAGRTVTHNLTVAPELMIVKGRSNAGQWRVYSSALGATQAARLNSTDSFGSNPYAWNNTAPTASVFTVGDDTGVNENTYTYVAYLFATCAGVSKVGSYTGNGSSQTINCGFTGGARFVMVKATSTTGNWIVADSARGIVAGNDPALYLNSTAAEVTGLDWIDADNSGFVVNETATIAANTNGVSYIFFAVA